jgi:hypothetical protein
MPIHVRAPDGSIAQFPDGTPDDTITKVMAREYGGPKSAAYERGRSQGGGHGIGGLQTFDAAVPFLDEFKAGAQAGIDTLSGKGSFGENWKTQRDWQAGARDAYQAKHPIGANVAKGLAYDVQAVPAFLSGGATAAPNVFASQAAQTGFKAAAGRVAAEAGRNAVVGGSYAAGNVFADEGTLSERMTRAGRAVPAGAAVGVALPAVIQGVAGVGRRGLSAASTRLAAPRPAPRVKVDIPALAKAKGDAYDAAENAGVRYSPKAFQDLIVGIRDEMGAAHMSEMRHPKAYSMMQDMEKMVGDAPSLNDLDQLRQVIRRDVAKSNDEAERFFGQKMIASIDEFTASVGPRQVVGGDAKRGAEAIVRARDLNTRLRKAEDVTEATDKAELRAASTGSGGNADNAIRQNLRRILETRKNLTDEERAALELAVKGGPVQNALRLFGRLSPDSGGLSLMMNLGSAGATHGMSLPVSAAGYGSKLAADQITKANVGKVLELIVNGPRGNVPASETQQLLAKLAEAAANDPALSPAYEQALRATGGRHAPNVFAIPVGSQENRR